MWVGDEKIAAIGVRVARGRTRHGFALNVDPDLAMFDHIVPCGIRDRGVTSMARVLGDAPDMHAVVDRVVARFAEAFEHDRRRPPGRRVAASRPTTSRRSPRRARPATFRCGCSGGWPRPAWSPRSIRTARRPEWMRVRARFDDGYLELKKLVRDLDLHTVCEEAGCPNIYECWADRTATFMILGDRCTRACGFCLVDTRKPLARRPRRAATGRRRGAPRSASRTSVITCVARDDLADGGASVFAATVDAIRGDEPGHRGRAADLRLQGRRRVARHDLRRRGPTC